INGVADYVRNFADRNVASGSEIDLHSDRAIFSLGSCDKTCNGIRDKGEVAARCQVTEVNAAANNCLLDDGGDDGARGLPGSKRIEWAQCNGWYIERTYIALHEFVGGMLARRVWTLGLDRVFFVDRNINGSTEDFTCRRMDEPPYV